MPSRRPYFLAFLILLIIEILIAVFVRDRIVRPYVGDYLVVMLVYAALQMVLLWPVAWACIVTLLFAYAVETGQAFGLVDRLGLGKYQWARIIIGTGFAWEDMIAYTLGVLTIWLVEKRSTKRILRP